MIKRATLMIITLLFLFPPAILAIEFSADSIMVMSGQESTGKVYFKNQDLARNELMGMISIIKRPNVYHLFPDSKKYAVTNLTEAVKKNPMADAADFKGWMAKHDMQKVGADRLEGYDCDIYAGDIKFNPEAQPIAMRVWYAKKLDYPVKSESTLPAPMGKMIAYIKNIQVGKQPDNLFEVPADYTRVDSIQEAMGLPNFQMGQDMGQPADGEQMPSEEDMEKMMKQMQEMMKKMQKQNGSG